MKSKEPPLLMTPGPTYVPERILKALSRPLIHHREKEFLEMVQNCTERLKQVFKTKNDLFILTSSGTGAMEAAISNTISPGDKVLSVVNGVFSERLSNIATSFGATVRTLSVPHGQAVEPAKFKEVFQSSNYKLVTIVHNETYSAVKNPVAEIGKIVNETDSLLLTDAISSLGGDDIRTDEWGVDFCLAGSQKCLMLPPGLAFITVSEKAWGAIDKKQGGRFYFNLKKYKEKAPDNPWTTAINLVFGLDESLNMIFEEGLENRIKRHTQVAEHCRKEIKKLGFQLFATPESVASQTLTSVLASGRDVEKMRSIVKQKYNIQMAGGQKDLKGKIFRIGHMGAIGKKEVDLTIDAISKSLKEL
ncbi:TPA: alanine--glyoxylate aminotransferase family protein [archaeon]|uniref:Alanine--glyoxylate aminotransferase family protein n=1 Tax=Candidatus Naiadarchaeum limnaeum TaxID=2756139 RepID=A0A832X5Q7_9ARCH|nr:alanine--glyoxylate aminotransferase family protein [Candidatus Naiadarchaeum limnaeum]